MASCIKFLDKESGKNILVSGHIIKRLKERLNIPKRAAAKFISDTLKNGRIIEEALCDGYMRVIKEFNNGHLLFYIYSGHISFATVFVRNYNPKHNMSQKYRNRSSEQRAFLQTNITK